MHLGASLGVQFYYRMLAIKVDRVRGLKLVHPLRKVALRGHYDQMKMILRQDTTIPEEWE
jgi:hypothetical protein